jgi:hypothetical protein
MAGAEAYIAGAGETGAGNGHDIASGRAPAGREMLVTTGFDICESPSKLGILILIVSRYDCKRGHG